MTLVGVAIDPVGVYFTGVAFSAEAAAVSSDSSIWSRSACWIGFSMS